MKPQTTEAERRKSVEIAIADSRLEGMPPPSGPEQAILEAFIRGEIAPDDLMGAVLALVDSKRFK
jgi:hypothetical protein